MRKKSIALLLTSLVCSLDAAVVSIEGVATKQRDIYHAQLKPRLEFINDREATPWRADDAAFFLERLMIRSGYLNGTVEWQIKNPQSIVLKVNLGDRFLFGSVSASNNEPLSEEQLDDYFFQPLIDTELVKRSEAPFQRDYPMKGAENVQNYLRSIGYWGADVSVSRVIENKTTKKVDIRLGLRAGRLHKLAAPKLKGASVSDRKLIEEEASPLIGKEATTENITKLNSIVNDYYGNKGYQFAKINLDAKHISGVTTLHFSINSGERFKIKSVVVKGNSRTKSSRFRRYVGSLEGEYFDDEEVGKVTSRLLQTGAFEKVVYRVDPVDATKLDLVYKVAESKAKSIRSYVGFGTFERGIIGLSYTDLNFIGRLQRLNVRGEYSGRGLLGEISHTEPFFGGKPINKTSRAFILQRSYDSYKKEQTGYEIAFSRGYDDHFNSRIYGAIEYASVSSGSLTKEELGPNDYVNTRFGFEQTIDFRDNAVLPTQGFQGVGLLEMGAINGDASTSYIKGDIQASYRHQISEKHRLHLSFGTGVIAPSESRDLPIDKRFFSGGADSVRSFAERELGPKSSSGANVGGQAYWNASAEYIYSLTDMVGLVGFYDMGQVYRREGDFGFNNPTHAVGLGVRLDLPIGPVRLEYGYNLNPQVNEKRGALHFAIGATF